MNFYTIESLVDGEKISSSGIDIMKMSQAFEILDSKSNLKTLDNVMGQPFIFLSNNLKFSDSATLIFAEQSKKLTFALVKENTVFKVTNGQDEYACAIHEGKLNVYKNEQDLNQALGQVSLVATDPIEVKALNWLDNGRVGLSSATLCATLFPNLKSHHRFEGMFDDDDNFEINWPHDNDDFKRCHKFLEAVPEAKARLDEMKTVSPEWNNLVAKWDDITKLSQEGKGEEVYDVISQCVKLKKVKNSI